jgi:hypothetical protein
MIPAQRVVRIPPHPFSLIYRIWPVAVLGVALIVWMAFSGSSFSSCYSNMGRHSVIFTQERN